MSHKLNPAGCGHVGANTAPASTAVAPENAAEPQETAAQRVCMLMTRLCAALIALLLSACGGGGAVSDPPPPPVAPQPLPPVSPPDFGAVSNEVERWTVNDAAVLIGTAEGELYRYEKGALRADTQLNIASASKWLTGMTVWSLVESGSLSLDTQPQDHVAFWSSDPDDPRSAVTLEHLLSFRSGFNSRPSLDSCPGDRSLSLEACIRSLHDAGVQTAPGAAFAYGPDHMQIAALVTREATGRELSDHMRARIWEASGVSARTAFPSTADNVRYSGGIRSTAEDYGRILSALMAGDLVSLESGFLSERTSGSQTAYTIPAMDELTLDWRYGFGAWVECDTVPFSQACDTDPTVSSPGAYGFLPWIDLEAGYWAVIAIDEPLSRAPRPSVAAIELQQILQPLIAAEF